MPNQQQISTTPADARDEWRTPPWLFRWLDERFQFEADMAATRDNGLCPVAFTRSQDSLSFRWDADARGFSRVWVNPPYSDIDPWIEQAIDGMHHGLTVVMLFPSPNGEDRFGPTFQHASEIIDIVGRLAFLRPDGTPVSGNTRGSSVYIFDPALRGAPCRRWWVMRDEIRRKYE